MEEKKNMYHAGPQNKGHGHVSLDREQCLLTVT